ncbi:PREDICTED: uncharacterized protein LOC104722715 isoform X1 [Camelina sativa]|uniref:Uncharacterized protein LOC104722715 isoform X1 n=1 Tax=Camelina sativa TaxID=90675 RepID=A0ABM1QM84_CAMSA|nr:PREDICTED: uncharacterized protein LOC104722715 isoform X1 [Camelina sativa]
MRSENRSNTESTVRIRIIYIICSFRESKESDYYNYLVQLQIMEARRLAILCSHLNPHGPNPSRDPTLRVFGCSSGSSGDDGKVEPSNLQNDCVFCKIIRGESQCLKLYEDDMCLCILDTNPLRNGHSLIIPKLHYPTLEETPPSVVAAMCSKVPLISTAIVKATDSGKDVSAKKSKKKTAKGEEEEEEVVAMEEDKSEKKKKKEKGRGRWRQQRRMRNQRRRKRRVKLEETRRLMMATSRRRRRRSQRVQIRDAKHNKPCIVFLFLSNVGCVSFS